MAWSRILPLVFLLVWLVPALIDEARKYPAVFRPKEKIMALMPIGMVATFVAILVAAIIFAMIHQGGSGIAEGTSSAFDSLTPYMGAQRFRTPRALDLIKKRLGAPRHNAALAMLHDVFQKHTTMWAEGVWEIVRAKQSPTKFLVTDDPVTFYCKHVFPSEWSYPNEISLRQTGTRTIFSLGMDSCLIITHLQLVRGSTGLLQGLRTSWRWVMMRQESIPREKMVRVPVCRSDISLG